MKHEIKLEAGIKRCPKCGEVIPASIVYFDTGTGLQTMGENRLICEGCARLAMPPKPPVRRLRRGEKHEDQLPIDAPAIRID